MQYLYSENCTQLLQSNDQFQMIFFFAIDKYQYPGRSYGVSIDVTFEVMWHLNCEFITFTSTKDESKIWWQNQCHKNDTSDLDKSKSLQKMKELQQPISINKNILILQTLQNMVLWWNTWFDMRSFWVESPQCLPRRLGEIGRLIWS